MEDQLILVDVYDNQIGSMGKAEAHRLGRLHRAFSIFSEDKRFQVFRKGFVKKCKSFVYLSKTK